MADIAAAAGVSKPLIYHYFSTKTDLYVAAVRSAAEELNEATRPDPNLPVGPRMTQALNAHLDWIDQHGLAYRAILQGGISSHPVVQAIVEHSRAAVLERLADTFGYTQLTAPQRIALRGWIGFLESACLDWLTTRDITKPHLSRLLATSIQGTLQALDVQADPLDSSETNPLRRN